MGIGSSMISIAASVILFASAMADAAAQAPPTPMPQIVTSASGEARLSPDRANILIGVQTRAPTAAAAARENAARQQAIIAAITAAGIPKEQISTENYNVYAETRSDRAGQNPVVIGYVVSNVVRVEVRRTDQVGPVIDAALAKGANQINSLEFFSSNTDAGRRQALTEAIGKARGDGEAMARAAGGWPGATARAVDGRGGAPPPAVSRRRDDGQVSGADSDRARGADPPRRGDRPLAVRAESMTTSTASMPLAFRPEPRVQWTRVRGSTSPAPPCSARRARRSPPATGPA